MCVAMGRTFVSSPAGIKVFDGATMPFRELEVPLDEYAGHSAGNSHYRYLDDVVAGKFAETRYDDPVKLEVTRGTRWANRSTISSLAKNITKDIAGPKDQTAFFGQLGGLNGYALQGFPLAIEKVRDVQFPDRLDRASMSKSDWEKVAVSAQLGSVQAYVFMIYEIEEFDAKNAGLVADLLPSYAELINLNKFQEEHAERIAPVAELLMRFSRGDDLSITPSRVIALLKMESILKGWAETRATVSNIESFTDLAMSSRLDEMIEADRAGAITAMALYISHNRETSRPAHEKVLLTLRDIDVSKEDVPVHIAQALYVNFNNRSAFGRLAKVLKGLGRDDRDLAVAAFNYVIDNGSLRRAKEALQVVQQNYPQGLFKARDIYRNRLLDKSKGDSVDVLAVAELLSSGVYGVYRDLRAETPSMRMLEDRQVEPLIDSGLITREHIDTLAQGTYLRESQFQPIWLLLRIVDRFALDTDPVKAALAVYAAQVLPEDEDFVSGSVMRETPENFNKDLHRYARKLFLLRNIYDAWELHNSEAAHTALKRIGHYNGGVTIGDVSLLGVE